MITAIAAIGKNGELGKNGDLIWRVPDDMKRLKELTTDHPLIMGRKTYESIGRPLPNRTNIIITRDNAYTADGCVIASSVEDALEKARESEGSDEIFIFGGAEIYAQALPYTDRLYLTRFDAGDADADTFFPDYSAFTQVIEKEKRDHDGLSFEWVTLEK